MKIRKSILALLIPSSKKYIKDSVEADVMVAKLMLAGATKKDIDKIKDQCFLLSVATPHTSLHYFKKLSEIKIKSLVRG